MVIFSNSLLRLRQQAPVIGLSCEYFLAQLYFVFCLRRVCSCCQLSNRSGSYLIFILLLLCRTDHEVPTLTQNSAAPTPAVPSTNSKIDDILASLNELQKNVPELVGSDSSSVDEGIRNLLKQFQSSETSSTSSVSQGSGSVNNQVAEREGAQDATLGDTTDDARSQGEDLLVIQED